MENLAPIILFVYNRPEHTKKTVEGLLSNPEAKDSLLYIFADGPKPTITAEGLNNLKATRSYIHTITGFKDIIIDESEVNRGLAPATIRGCTIVLNKHGKMIFIEDDDIPSPYFLKFINEGLNKYEHDKRIWSVCGFIEEDAMASTGGNDVFMVNRPCSWGYGTWKRCWDKVIWDIDDLRGIFRHKDVIHGFNKWGGCDHYHTMHKLLNGQNSSWSIRYHFAAYLNDMKTIYPSKSLIANIGWDGSGTHCGKKDFHLTMVNEPVCFPQDVKFDEYRNRQYINFYTPKRLIGKVEEYAFYHPWANTIVWALNKIKNVLHYHTR